MSDSKKTIAIAIVAIVIVAAVAGAIAIAMTNGNGGGMEKTDLTFKTADGSSYDVYRGSYHLKSEGIDADVPFYYSDGYFLQDAKTENEHLTSLSMVMSTAAFGTDRNPMYSAIQEMYGKLGFGNCYISSDYNKEPTMNTAAFACATKKISIEGKEKTVVSIVFRSSNYGMEWLNNLLIGISGEESGPSSCADAIIEEFSKYLKDRGIDGNSENTVFWLSGYSRGGMLSNLVGKRIIDAYDNNGSRTHCYCFASSMAGIKEAMIEGYDYSSIVSVIDDTDTFTKTMFGYMGFIRYGTERHLPAFDEDSEVQKRMLKFLEHFGGEPQNTELEMYVMIPGEGPLGIRLPSFIPAGTKMSFSDFEQKAIDVLGKYCDLTREATMKLAMVVSEMKIPEEMPSIGVLINIGVPLLDLLFAIENEASKISDIDKYVDMKLSNYDIKSLSEFLEISQDDCRFLLSVVMKYAYGDCMDSGTWGFGFIGTIYTSYAEILSHSQPVYYVSWVLAGDDYYTV